MIKTLLILLVLFNVVYGDFYTDGIYNNHWLWFHVYEGAVLTVALNKVLDVPPMTATIYVISLAIAWEVFEYFNDLEAYRNTTHFLYDGMGDIAGAGIASVSVAIFL